MPTIESSRLYYHDGYRTEFSAGVVETLATAEGPAVVLDTTCFYPTSGGQPHDVGGLGARRVLNVSIRETDHAILHHLSGPLPIGPVEGTVDWARRRDHMQQHTGQHILSQAFLRTAGAATVGFHLGAEYVSIDLDGGPLDAAAMVEAITLANGVVMANLPVRSWFPGPEELQTISLRKTPDVDGALRVVAIGDFDISACGGTHVRQSVEVGLIHCLRSERLKRGTRVSFLCGGRARADFADKQAIVSELTAALTCSVGEIPAAVERLQAELQESRRELNRYREQDLDREADTLHAAASGTPALVARGWPQRPVEEIRGLTLRLTARPDTIALLAAVGERTQFVFGRSEDLSTDLKPALDAALAVIGGGKGGGSRIVQGGGRAVDPATADLALTAAARAIGLGIP